MKKLYLLALCQIIFLFTYSAPIITAVNTTGQWNATASWDLGRLPANADTVLIPIGRTITITNNQNLGTSTLIILVYGKLKLSGGKISLDANSEIKVFTGGKISGTGSSSETIKIGGAVQFKGTNPNILGPMLANSSTPGFVPFSEIPLSVKFVGFNVAWTNNDVLVQWITSEEINNSYFEVQRSYDGISWNTIATLYSYSINSSFNNYSYNDRNNTAGVSFYRIRQVDLDGKFTMTGVRMIRNTDKSGAITISSAGPGMVYLHFAERINSNITVNVISVNGQIISQNNYSNPFGMILMSVNASVNGLYIVAITDAAGLMNSKQVVL